MTRVRETPTGAAYAACRAPSRAEIVNGGRKNCERWSKNKRVSLIGQAGSSPCDSFHCTTARERKMYPVHAMVWCDLLAASTEGKWLIRQ
jgi:hypothetical protein